MGLQSPCFGCKNRSAICHGVCPLYREFEKRNAEWRKQTARYLEADFYKREGINQRQHREKTQGK